MFLSDSCTVNGRIYTYTYRLFFLYYENVYCEPRMEMIKMVGDTWAKEKVSLCLASSGDQKECH